MSQFCLYLDVAASGLVRDVLGGAHPALRAPLQSPVNYLSNNYLFFLLLPVLYPLVSAARLVGVVVKRADPRLSVPLELPIFNLRKDQSNIYGVCCTAT